MPNTVQSGSNAIDASPSLTDVLEGIYQKARAADAPLNARLKIIADGVRGLSPGFADAVDAFVARLDRAGAGDAAPKVGAIMPPFVLPDENGRLVSLDDLLGKAPVIVAFHRGHWCPYCRLNATALANAQQELSPARIVAVSAERLPYVKALKADSGATFPFLTDVDNGYALLLNLAIWVDDTMAGMISAMGIDVPAYQGGKAWILPIPAVFVVGADGVIRARHVDPDYRQRMEIEDLLAAVRSAVAPCGEAVTFSRPPTPTSRPSEGD